MLKGFVTQIKIVLKVTFKESIHIEINLIYFCCSENKMKCKVKTSENPCRQRKSMEDVHRARRP